MSAQSKNDPSLNLAPADVQALSVGHHQDPFAVLGAHPCTKGRRLGAVVPGAATVQAIIGKDAYDLTASAQSGDVFVGLIPAKGDYTLRATSSDGTTWEWLDPYSFGPVLGDMDEYLLGEGTHQRLWTVLGAHPREHEGVQGTSFAVWAPNAQRVSVVGDFNVWDGRRHVMRRRGATGVWELFIPGLGEGVVYKYELIGQHGETLPQKADPVGFGSQHPPENASVVRDISGYGWNDDAWMKERAVHNNRDAPMSIYEVHLGSWKRKFEDGNRPLSYKEAAIELIDYVSDMGFTHIEFLPLSEFPFDGSWGYQPVGMFAPTVRHGPPHEFRDLIEAAHNKGVGVLLDWVPGHFPTDAHGLGRFDGTALYEHADPREGFHQDWNTLIYNYGRSEVANYLVSNALYWLEEYHVDGLRVDAVASMLYRDYSREHGQWIPNKDGGRENYEAIDMLRAMNTITYGEVPGIMTAAEESTSFPAVSQPVSSGGLGFGFKWNMGWMNDTLEYISKEPIYRRHHHHQMTFGLHYAFSENFILPISHDEVVHGKGSMLQRMPGPEWEKFANLRAYYGFMFGHPGKKLLFMGCEFAQPEEWNNDGELNWEAAATPAHAGVQNFVRDLNRLYRDVPALHLLDCDPAGFQWIESNDAANSVYSWIRRNGVNAQDAVVICNFTPVERDDYAIGLPMAGKWREVLNSDAEAYGGGNRGNIAGVDAIEEERFGQPASAKIYIPPLSCIILMPEKIAAD